MISKARTECLLGYKSQVARSLAGFITAIEIPEEEAVDSSMDVHTLN